MAAYQYKAGLGNVGSYQVSGKPYAEGGIDATNAQVVTFPSVTSWVSIKNNTASELRVGFSAAGVSGANYLTVASGSVTSPMDLKLTEVHLSGSSNVDVIAGLTYIESKEINNPGASPGGLGATSPNVNWTGSAGVG